MFFKRHVATAIADVKKGFVIRHKNKLCEVMGALHHTKGRGGGHYKLDLKDLKSGSRVSERFNTGIFVETVQKTMRTMQFLYEDKEIHLLDPDTFEEMSVPMHMVSNKKFLKENEMVHVLCIDEEPVQIQLPLRLPFKVMDTAPVGAASDSKDTSTDMKPARLENGTILNVPEFIHPGETILVNTEKGIFHSRAK